MLPNFNIEIKKVIVHILDNNLPHPVLSELEHPLNKEVNDYLQKHLQKILISDELSKCTFNGVNNITKQLCKEISDDEGNFQSNTAKMANRFFEIMTRNIDICAADLVVCLLTINGMRHLGIIKFNYQNSYIHYTENQKSMRLNTILKQKTTLPSDNQKVSECAIINLEDFNIQLIEKKCNIEGKMSYYFSLYFFNSSASMSNREKFKIFNKVTEQYTNEIFDSDFEKSSEMKSVIANCINESDEIDIDIVADTMFSRNANLRDSYIDKIEKSGLNEKTILIDGKVAEKRFKKQRLETDNGIEINFPVSYYNDKNIIDFINNPDGTISILIKNVNRVTGK